MSLAIVALVAFFHSYGMDLQDFLNPASTCCNSAVSSLNPSVVCLIWWWAVPSGCLPFPQLVWASWLASSCRMFDTSNQRFVLLLKLPDAAFWLCVTISFTFFCFSSSSYVLYTWTELMPPRTAAPQWHGPWGPPRTQWHSHRSVAGCPSYLPACFLHS